MKLYLNAILTLFVLFSCTQEKPESIINQTLLGQLQDIVELRFCCPEKVDSALIFVAPKINKEATPYAYALFLFLKAEINIEADNYKVSEDCIDSIALVSPVFAHKNEERIALLKARLYEHMLLYEEALSLYKPLLEIDKSQCLSPNEHLMLVIGISKIAFSQRKDLKVYESIADSIVNSTQSYIDNGYYWAYKAYISDNIYKEIEYFKKALAEYRSRSMQVKEFKTICNLADCYSTVSIDSARYYIAIANECFAKAPQLIVGNEKELYLHYVNAYISRELDLYTKSIEEAIKASKIANRLHKEYALYNLHILISENHKDLGNVSNALKHRDLALRHRLEFSSRINSSRIQYFEKVNELDRLKMCHDKFQAQAKSRRLTIYAVFVSLLLLLFVLYYLYKDRSLLFEKLSQLKEKAYIREVENISLEKKVAKIQSYVAEDTISEKFKIRKIYNELQSDTLSWEEFYKKYQFRYPSGESILRAEFPVLSESDINYLMCLQCNLSYEDMATIFDVAKDSVRKRFNRIRAKLNGISLSELKNRIAEEDIT